MKKILYLFILLFAVINVSIAQVTVCEPNMNFELGNYSSWSYFIGTCCPIVANGPVTPPSPRFALTSVPSTDICCNFPVTGEGVYSLRLGYTVTNYLAEKAVYYVHVPAGMTNYALVYRYAFVLQDPVHTLAAQPRFEATAVDSNTGDTVSDYLYIAGAIPGTYISTYAGVANVVCKSWATQTIDLTGHAGSTVIMSFAAGDCGLGAHFGYAYIDMTCGLFAINTYGYCGSALLEGPAGFASYEWYDSSTFTTLLGTDDTLYVNLVSPMHLALVITPYSGFGVKDTLYTSVFPGVGTGMQPITGATNMCVGGSTLLANITPNGTWTSTVTSVADVAAFNPNTGIVFGLAAGTSVISYFTVAGCSTTTTVTVSGVISPIAGPQHVCAGQFISLSDATPGGTWSSSNTSIATVNSVGVVRGVTTGNVLITYALPCGFETYWVSVNQSPSAIAGTANLCIGDSAIFINSAPGGMWTSNNTYTAIVTPGGTVKGTGPGSTAINYTTPGGCIRSYTITVKPPPSVIVGSNAGCTGQTITLSNSVGGGTWTSGTPSVATVGQISGIVTGISGGATVITYATFPGAVCSATTTITVSPGPSAISGSTNICQGNSIALSDSVSGGTWSSSNTVVASITPGGIVYGADAGNAVILYSMPGGCVSSVTVTVDAIPSVISGSMAVCMGAAINLSNTVAGGVWSSGSTGVATVTNTGVVTGVSAGTAVISYVTSISTGCFATTTVNVTPGAAAISGSTSMCVGSSVTLSNSVAGGAWSSSNASVATFVSGTTVKGVAAGSAVITYMMPAGCFRTVTVVVAPVPSIMPGSVAVCAGLTITLSNTVAGGIWTSTSPGVVTVVGNTGVVTGVSVGSAVISYTTTGGVGCTVSTIVMVSPGPSSISGNTNICIGAQVTLSNTVAGGAWSSSNSSAVVYISGNTFDGVGLGSSVISYTMPGGCYRTTTVTVRQPPSAISGLESVCSGLFVTLSNTVSGGTWVSMNPGVATVDAITGTVTGVSAGNAVISYITSNGIGCATATTVTVNVGAAPITGNAGICLGSMTTLSNTMPGGSWSGNNPSIGVLSGSTITGIGVGTAVITYMVAGGCYRTATVTVSEPPAVMSGSLTVCSFASIMLSNSVAGGNWTTASPTIATVGTNTGIVTGISAGSAVISYATAADAACIVTTTVTVLSPPDAGAIAGPSIVCAGSTIALTNAMTGGVWSTTPVGIATISVNGLVTGISAGTATVSYTITTLCGPVSAATLVSIVAKPDAGAILGGGHVCAGESIVLSNTASGGVWSSSNSLVAVSNGVLTGVASGTGIISYIITNSCGADTATTTIVIDQAPVVGTISGSDIVCSGAEFNMTATMPGGVWSSSSGAVTINSSTGQSHAVGNGVTIITYTITSDSNSCIGLATHTVTVSQPTFGVNAAVTNVSCHGGSDGRIIISVAGSTSVFTYLWSTGNVTMSISGLTEGVYALNIHEISTQCFLDTAFSISEPDQLVITDSVLRDLCGSSAGAIYLAVSGGTPSYNYLWSMGAGTPNVEHLHSGVYTVTVTDMHNCTSILPSEVTDSVCSGIKIHDAMTPNGDGINDTWIIEGIEGYPESIVMLFDKWGDKVFEQRNYRNDWSCGGKHGQLPDGTYYYLIKLNAKNMAGGPDAFTGNMLIKR